MDATYGDRDVSKHSMGTINCKFIKFCVNHQIIIKVGVLVRIRAGLTYMSNRPLM